jgi:hypothetical protein
VIEEIAFMPRESTAAPQMIGKLAVRLTDLPEEDLRLVVQFVDCLGEKRSVDSPPLLSAAEMRMEALRRARLLRDVPREQLIARFFEVGEQIRREAISGGTAVDGDWTGD